VKEQVKQGNIAFQYVLSLENIADLFTKALPNEKIHQFASRLNLTNNTQDMLNQWKCYDLPLTGLLHQKLVAVIDGWLWELAVIPLGRCNKIGDMGTSV